MLAPVLNYSKELKCLIHFSWVGQWPVTKGKIQKKHLYLFHLNLSKCTGIEDTLLHMQKQENIHMRARTLMHTHIS